MIAFFPSPGMVVRTFVSQAREMRAGVVEPRLKRFYKQHRLLWPAGLSFGDLSWLNEVNAAWLALDSFPTPFLSESRQQFEGQEWCNKRRGTYELLEQKTFGTRKDGIFFFYRISWRQLMSSWLLSSSSTPFERHHAFQRLFRSGCCCRYVNPCFELWKKIAINCLVVVVYSTLQTNVPFQVCEKDKTITRHFSPSTFSVISVYLRVLKSIHSQHFFTLLHLAVQSFFFK